MPSLYTRFKNAIGGSVDYAEIDAGTSSDGIARRVPQSAPSDAAGAPLYAAGVIPALDGTDVTGSVMPAGGVGIRGWLSGIYAKLSGPLTVQGTVTVTDGSGPLTVDGTVGLAAGALTGLAQDGTDATGVTPPAGAVGIRGWLSAIYSRLPPLVGGKIPVAIDGESVVITGPITVSNEVEVKNDSGNPLPISRPPLTFTAATGFPKALTASWQFAVSTTAATKGLRIGTIGSPSAYDIEWTVVPSGSAAPTDPYGEGVGGGEDFPAGLPIGDVYLRSASLQVALVKTGA